MSTEPFIWITNGGTPWPVKKMETTHVFHSFRLIWNHTMPTHVQISQGNRYKLSDRFTPEYCKAALVALGNELNQRSDLPEHLTRQLRRMQSNLAGRTSYRTQKKNERYQLEAHA